MDTDASTTPVQSGSYIKFIGDTLRTDPGRTLSFDDYPARREQVFNFVQDAVSKRFPVSNVKYTINVTNLRYEDMAPFSIRQQKDALLNRKSLGKRLKGNWVLTDNATGQTIDRTNRKTIVNVPWLSDRGTYIRNGVEQVLINQFRLVPGVFTRRSADGSIESHVNVRQGTGSIFKVSMDPATAEFNILAKNRKIKLYPVLKALGVDDSILREAWGDEILKKNQRGNPEIAMKSVYHTFLPKQMAKTAIEEVPKRDEALEFRNTLQKMELDPEATKETLGRAYHFVSPDLFVDVTRKILKVSKGEIDTDDRDSMEFQRLYGGHNFMAERIIKDPGGLMKKLLWKITNKGGLKTVPSGYLNKHVDNLFNASGMSQKIEEINPINYYDQNFRVTRLGEGGISSLDAAPEDAVGVQPTYRGYVDPIRSPEGPKVGLDMRMAHGVRYGENGLLYRKMMNVRSGKREDVDSVVSSNRVVAFPDTFSYKGNFVPAAYHHKGIQYTPRKDIDYLIESPDDLFSTASLLSPNGSSVKGMRMLTGSSQSIQALPLVHREAPLVRTLLSDGRDIHEAMGVPMGLVKASAPGVVKSVDRNHIVVTGGDGADTRYELYDNFPYSRKTYIRNFTKVKPGDRVGAGSTLATSNFTTDDGKLSVGTNLRVAFLPYRGHTYEDGIVISDEAARKLTSEHMYATKLKKEDGVEVSKTKYTSLFPAKYKDTQLKKIGENGVVKIGSILNPGDPVILSTRTQLPSIGTMGRRLEKDHVAEWEHEDPGVVTDVSEHKDGWHVYTRVNSPAREGDKLSGAAGNKGVVSMILPRDQMLHDAKGQPFDILFNPIAVPSRTNPALVMNALLAKIAAKTGRPYVMPLFSKDPDSSLVDFVEMELHKNGISDTEDIFDPVAGRKIPSVMTGISHYYKLHHTAESKSAGRGFGSYTIEEQPVSGGSEGGKKIGLMECTSLMSHQAFKTLKDAKLVRGQKNDEYWRKVRMGENPTPAPETFAFQKFKALLPAGGINLTQKGNSYNIFTMTNDQVKELTGNREIQNTDTYDPRHFRPMPGGLFDEHLTGGTEGNHFSFIRLDEPMLNPVAENMVRRLLGVTEKELMQVISGEKPYKGRIGGHALKQMLDDLPVHSEILRTMAEIKGGTASRRDAAVKRLHALSSLKENKVNASDFMLDRVPVMPPRFRPIVVSDDMNMAHDFNYLYRDMLNQRNDFRDAKKILPEESLREGRLNMYRTFKAVVGLADPLNVELKEMGVRGVLSHLFGKDSPKYSFYQRRLIGGAVDLSARATLANNPNLGLDDMGMPEGRAWELFEPFIVRHMVRGGMKATDAVKAVQERSGDAKKALEVVMRERPVLLNRAPTMHKYSIMAFRPHLVKGNQVQMPNQVFKGFNADCDGDNLTIHVPVSADAVQEAYGRMLPSRSLFGPRSFKPAYVPSQEYILGAYYATKAPKAGSAAVFNTEEDAIKAYRQGQLDIDAPVIIKHRRIPG